MVEESGGDNKNIVPHILRTEMGAGCAKLSDSVGSLALIAGV